MGCGDPEAVETGRYAPDQWPYQTLSAYGFFEGRLADMQPADGVLPYQVAAPLWADHAGKARFIVLPPGAALEVDGDDWLPPVGSVVVKSFYYATDRRRMEETATLIETRLLIKQADGEWKGHTYVWNDDHSDAVRRVAGKRLQLEYVDASGSSQVQEYIVPNTNQCKDCHEIDDRARLLGVVGRQLDRLVVHDGEVVDQLDWLADNGVFGDAPRPEVEAKLVDPFGEADLDARARSYLDANCSHCHRDGGNGGPTGLVLLAAERSPVKNGVCKGPVAAGPGSGDRKFDVVPGAPDESILILRMESTDPEVKMPEIPNRLPHEPGIALIREWIENLPMVACD
jgi:uncharacterized repeat protein (TIGR03806 family)